MSAELPLGAHYHSSRALRETVFNPKRNATDHEWTCKACNQIGREKCNVLRGQFKPLERREPHGYQQQQNNHPAHYNARPAQPFRKATHINSIACFLTYFVLAKLFGQVLRTEEGIASSEVQCAMAAQELQDGQPALLAERGRAQVPLRA